MFGFSKYSSVVEAMAPFGSNCNLDANIFGDGLHRKEIRTGNMASYQ